MSESTPYDWYQRGLELLRTGNPDAAATVLERLTRAEPLSASAWEAYGQALFDAKRFDDAIDAFTWLLEREPDNDYAHFGLGMALWRRQRFLQARDELAMAFVMRPERADYAQALAQVKATLRARIEGGLPLEGPITIDPRRDEDIA